MVGEFCHELSTKGGRVPSDDCLVVKSYFFNISLQWLEVILIQ